MSLYRVEFDDGDEKFVAAGDMKTAIAAWEVWYGQEFGGDAGDPEAIELVTDDSIVVNTSPLDPELAVQDELIDLWERFFGHNKA